MKKCLSAICLSFAVLMVNAQATSIPYTGLLLTGGTAGPAGDDVVSDAVIPFTFNFYGSGYTTARISTNGFIWLSATGGEGCCNGFLIPSDPDITEPFIALTQTDWYPDIPASGVIFYDVVGTAPNRIFVVHYDNIKHISSEDRMTGEIQLFETTNEIRLVMSSLTGIPDEYTGTMGIAMGNGTTGYAVSSRNQSASYSITNEAWSLSAVGGTLPISLLSFEAVKKAGTAFLSWSTGTEENNNYFAIERSINGRDFKAIGKVDSKGNTTLGHQYNFTDFSPFKGKNYYRLVQYDIDGRASYYRVRMVSFEKQSEMKILPNPVVDQFNISIQSTQASKVQITVFDVHGRNIMEFTSNLTAGSNLIPVVSKEWPAGFYSIRINKNGTIITSPVISKLY